MNINLLHEKLIRAARSNPPSDHVPYAFEKRVLALIRTEPIIDTLAVWTRALWRASIPCVAVMLLFTVWAIRTPESTTSPDLVNLSVDADLGDDLETTLMASVSLDNDLPW